jgi:hypothetical protein
MTRLLSRGLFAAVVLAVLLVILGGGALAYFTSGGGGSASAAVTKLNAPTVNTPTVGAGTVTLSWGTVSSPGSSAVQYYVTRDGGDAAGTCATDAAPTAAISCVDSNVPIGEHSYVVTAVYKSWTTASGTKTANVLTGAATKFTISASTTSFVVNASVNLTITAKDSSNNTVTSYTGSKTLVFSGASAAPKGEKPTIANASGSAINFGSNTALTFSSGVASVSSSKNGLMKIYRSGVAEITATEGSITTPSPLVVTVSAGTASRFVLAAETTTPVAGAANDLTITTQDVYYNTATGYDGSKSVTFTGPAASPGGNTPTIADEDGVAVPIGTATDIQFDEGIATGDGGENGTMVFYKSGSNKLTATQGSLSNPTQLTATVSAATGSKLILTASNTSPAAAASTNLTLTARDPYENTATGYTGSKNIVFSGASLSPSGAAATVVNSGGTVVSFGSATALTFSSGVASVSSSRNGLARLNKAETANVSATDGTISTATPLTFTVSVGSANRVALDGLTSSAGSIGSPCYFTCAVTSLGNSKTITAGVMITDSVGNIVSGIGSTKTVTVTVSTGGSISGSPLSIPSSGLAIAATDFVYTSPTSGSFNHTITAASSGYTSATVTAK